MDILQIMREIERFKADAPPYTYLVFEKHYGVRRAAWKQYRPDIDDSGWLFSYAYKDSRGNFSEWSTAARVAKWFEEV